jgi:hypothetical protein
MDQTVIVGGVAGALWVCDRMGWLPSKKSAADAAGELVIAEKTITRLQESNAQLTKTNAQLEHERSNEPVLLLVNRVFETQQRTLDKLAHFNGALKRNEEGLREATEALRMVAGLVVGANDLAGRKPRQ